MRKYDDSRNMELYDEEDDLFDIEYDADQIEDVFARHLWALTAIQSNTFFSGASDASDKFQIQDPCDEYAPGDRIENARRRRLDQNYRDRQHRLDSLLRKEHALHRAGKEQS